MMRYVPWHVKGNRPAVRDVAGNGARRVGPSVGATLAMIRRDIQELRRQAALGRDGSCRSMEEFLAQLKTLLAHHERSLAVLQQQVATSAVDAIRGPAESIRRDVASLKEIQASVDRRTQDTFEAVYGTIERIVDRLAVIEEELRGRHSGLNADPLTAEPERHRAPAVRSTADADIPAPVPLHGSGMAAMLRQPAVPDLVADVPVRLRSAAESVPGPPPLSPGGRRFVLAARQAAEVLASAVPGVALSGKSRQRGKAAVLGVAAAMLILFAVTFTLHRYRSPAAVAPDSLPAGGEDRAAMDGDQPDEAVRLAESPSNQPTRQGSNVNPLVFPIPANANPLSQHVSAAVPAELGGPAAIPGPADAAGLDGNVSPLTRNVFLPAPATDDPWPAASVAPDLTANPLPPTIGSKALVAAASAGDPGASYEIAIRFAQGRNATPDFAMAAAWLDRAARAGLAPAQFRLGSMYEKGLGVRKDLAEARRLYVAAAAKGHAKAMHNLAVLYTGGIDGPPDYAAAAKWFRKAATYGTVDSQYNLGILYARGTGVERDLGQSYTWFALAAKSGDKDAIRKRDEVAKAIDPKQMENARMAAEAFVAVPQPDEATAVKAPAGGWDQVAAAATTKSTTLARPERSPGR